MVQNVILLNAKFESMKKLLIGLIALTITLGVACKKDEMSDPKLKLEKRANGDIGAIDEIGGDVIGENPFGLNGNTTSNYNSIHPWSVQYPNGWPMPHSAHPGCAGVKSVPGSDAMQWLWYPK